MNALGTAFGFDLLIISFFESLLVDLTVCDIQVLDLWFVVCFGGIL